MISATFRWIDRNGRDAGLLLLRLFAGGLMLVMHGLPKLLSFGDLLDSFPDPLGVGSAASLTLAVFAEVLCALAVVLGIGTRAAAVPLLVTMLVAAFIVHGADPWSKKELALVYAGMFATLVLLGGGRWRVKMSKLDRWS